MRKYSLFSLVAATVACAAFSASSVNAASTFNLTYQIGEINGLTAGVSKAILVVDVNGDGFMGINDTQNTDSSHTDISNFSFTSGTTNGDDYVLAVMTAEDLSGSGDLGFQLAGGGVAALSTATSYAGKQMAVLFFESGSNAVGGTYGFFRTSTVDDNGGTIAYFVPSDGGTDTILSATTSIGGSGTTFNGTPTSAGSIGAVPEPSRMILAGLGFLGLMLRRRRK